MSAAMSFKIQSVLRDKIVQEIFKRVAKQKSVRLNELVIEQGVSRGTTLDALSKLTNSGLIAERPSLLQDFNAYVITADGLAAARQIGKTDIANE